MSRRVLVLSLSFLQSLVLLAGTCAALTLPSRSLAKPQILGAAGNPDVREPHVTPVVAPLVTRAEPVVRPAPRPVRHPRLAVVTRRRPVIHVTRRPAAPALSPTERLMRAVNRIPGYHAGDAVWVITAKYGHWGTAELGGTAIFISPSVPTDRLYDVVAHEWSHVLSVEAYGFDAGAAMTQMNAYFGGTGIDGAERAADCMAKQLGATWTHYTSCGDARWQAGARRLLARQPL